MSRRAIGISGSPSSNSRSRIVTASVLMQLGGFGIATEIIDLLELPAEALLARSTNAWIDRVIQQVVAADIVLLGTPIYRASYAGQLKAFLDLLPQDALRGTVVGLIASGAGGGHLLALDHGLRPLVASMGGLSAASGIYVTDAQFPDKSMLPENVHLQTVQLAKELHLISKDYRLSVHTEGARI